MIEYDHIYAKSQHRKMNYKTNIGMGAVLLLLVTACSNISTKGFDPGLHEEILPMPPEESLKTMIVQDGYSMEIVAAEPLIEEPVTFAFDGNGRIYVAEMLTYMQDADSTGTFKSVSRIKRLEDKDGDGIFESFTVFADQLLLPRMISTLDDGRILIRETNTLDLLLLTDTDGDGVADQRETVFEGGERGGNLEHQPSGLIYSLDNWLYVTYTDKRYKFVGDKIISGDVNSAGGQWGLAHDKAGRIYFSRAGQENPVYGFQAPVIYNPASYVPIAVDGEQAPGFREVFPIDTTPDVQGGLPRLRDDNTLNHFTGGGGQSIYLAGIYDDMEGDYIIPEPVGNLIRRSKVVREDGHTVISNPYQSDRTEFVVSSDPNFRPLWTDAAPDGSLMVLDMYRGIIQEGNWTREGSYLRSVIDKYGFDKNIGRGRLYRIKKDGVPLYKQPKMFEQTQEELIDHLRHRHRWWRLEAQKLMVLSGDQSLIPALQALARNDSNPDARVHALWTLEGLGNLDKQLLTGLFNAENTAVRNAAIRISEQLVSAGDKDIAGQWLDLAADKDIEVAQQVLLSAWYVESHNRQQILQAVKQSYSDKKGVIAIEAAIARGKIEDEKRRLLASGNAEFATAMIEGEKAYMSLCSSCHGDDGKGSPATSGLIAPSLHDNPRVTGNTTLLVNVVLNGMQGEIDAVSYVGGMMPSIASNGDEYIANVLTYLRNNFGNSASMLREKDVEAISALYPDRETMWTQDTAEQQFSQPLENKSLWKVSTNFEIHKTMTTNYLIDGLDHNEDEDHWFSSQGNRTAGNAITLELPAPAHITEIILGGWEGYSSRSYLVEFSLDGEQWQVVAENKFDESFEKAQTFGHKTKFIRITNHEEGGRWIITELDLIGRADSPALSALIIDGQNNHRVWPKSTVMMKQYLEQTGLFEVDVYRSKPTWRGEEHPEYYQKFSDESQFHVKNPPQQDETFAPQFADYDVVISNFGHQASTWPKDTQESFEQYMKTGGGFVSVHAADNSFPQWLEYNKMIGVGGWGGRNEKNGPHLYYNDAGELVRNEQAGRAGNHGNKHELKVTKRSEHPILAGLPDTWMHTQDECYSQLRGPAERLQILATALCLKEENGNGLNEPMLMTVEYGDGRIFHTTLGHDTVAMDSVGFITTFQRGTEWAATGEVSQQVPADFPDANNSSSRDFDQK
jgi:type 1 glutamine amidotransferase/mono/diheme cytochrome c family protein